ncbi:MAG TPA: radical SAM protein [Polyangia bacterium]|nr:radical SAM protein [Polyangia bacterium]
MSMSTSSAVARRSEMLRLVPGPLPLEAAAELPLAALDTVWIQLTGTLCNIACRHCFITCGPKEDRVRMMTHAEVARTLAEAERLGVKEIYFTGGEPMLHPEFFDVLADSLAVAPTAFLSNGILIDDLAARRLRQLFDASRYSLDCRISLDGTSPETNDSVRGRGTFQKIARGIACLAEVGLAPVVTVVEHQEGMAAAEERLRFLGLLRELGVTRPRVKFLPLLRIGREPTRTHGYGEDEFVRPEDLTPEVAERLQCRSCRLVTADGVMTCPLLLDEPEARLGSALGDALGPIRLRWAACHTCVSEGLQCRT